MKSRLTESALSAVKITFTCQQPVSQRGAPLTKSGTFYEQIGPRDEHIANSRGVTQEKKPTAPDTKGDDIAVHLRK